MANKIVICVLMLVFYRCECYKSGPSLLDGLFSGAQTIGSTVNEVISGLAQGEVNLNFQGHALGQGGNPMHHHHGQYKPKPPGPPPPPESPETETIVVVVEEEQPTPPQKPVGHQQYGPPGYNHYNNYYRPDFESKPGYDNNYQPYDNHRPPHHHHHHHHNKPGYNYNYNPYGQGNQHSNGNHYGYNNGNQNPHKYGPNNYNNPYNQNGNYNGNYPSNGNQNDYSSTKKPQEHEPTEYQPKPAIETTKAPEQIPGYAHDQSKEPNADKKPNYSDNEQTSKKPGKDDAPLFVPLNPNQYTYGGDKIEINAPKRETNEEPKPAEDDEAYPIDIRLGDKP